MKSAVAYYRVSTQRQGRSGLGLEAQRTAVARFAEAEGITLLSEFTEVETGKGRRRARSTATACRSAGHSAPGEMSGAGCQARSPLARRGLHCRPDGPTCALHRGRARSGCRSLHAPPLRGAGREGAAANLGAHQERPRLSQAARARSSAIQPAPARQRQQGEMFRRERPIALPRASCRSSRRFRNRASPASRHRNRAEQPRHSNSARRRMAGVECAQCIGETSNAGYSGRFIGGTNLLKRWVSP